MKQRAVNAVDLVVETYMSPEQLDRIVEQLPMVTARVVGIGEGGPVRVDGHPVVRCFGSAGFLRFALENQGYGKVVRQLDQLL